MGGGPAYYNYSIATNNHSVNSGPILTSGSVATIPYAYTVDTPSTVKDTVTANAGNGKIT